MDGSRNRRRVGVGRSTRRVVLASVLATTVAAAGFVATAGVAAADGPSDFSNVTAISIPATGSANQIGPAAPYPSPITVSGLAGTVSKVTLTLNGVTHGAFGDIDAMLVSPGGQNLVFLSDLGGSTQLVTAANRTLTFDDSAAGPVPAVVNLASGTYRPTDTEDGLGADTFPAPAPAPSSQTTLAGAFTGVDPNGTWNLYIVDDATGDVGTVAGGWTLTLTTQVAAASTTTSVTTSGSPSVTGQPVTFTAAVSSAGSPVPAGTVQFSDGGTTLGTVSVDGSGHASLTTSSLTEGSHQVVATYSGTAGFLTSNGSVAQRVDNATVVNGSTFCNTGTITTPTVGTAQPYPSNIVVSGLPGQATKVTVTVKGLSHQAPIDFDVMLVGPTPSQNLLLLSDAGGQNPVSNLDLTFDDDAAGPVPVPAVSGTYRPTDADDESSDGFPAPAPVRSTATALSTFDGADPNGTWSLYVVDDASGDSGSIAGGWCLTVTTPAATSTSLTSTVNPASNGQSVTFTATVTSGGAPVPVGTVTFSDGGSSLGSPVSVAADGTATLTTSSLGVGSHPLTATYAGTDAFGASSASLTQVVTTVATTTVLTASPNPAVSGQSVTFTATVTAAGSPVPSGEVVFSDDGTSIGAAVPVAADGTATLTTSSLAVGSHPISAAYQGTATYAGSGDVLTQVVSAPAAHDPSITAQVSSPRPRTSDGWYRAPVTVTFTCTPHGSPLTAPCPAPVQLGSDGAGQSVTRSIGSADGGVASITVGGIDIDQTDPLVAIDGMRAGKRYVGKVPSAHCVGRDALSGLARCVVHRTRHRDHVTYVATATDKAGNTASVRVRVTVLKASVAGAPFRNGAYTVRVGKTYTLIAYGKKQPRYVNAAVFPNRPAGLGGRFHKVGHRQWELGVTFTTAPRGYRYWNVGVKIGHTVHVLKIRLRMR